MTSRRREIKVKKNKSKKGQFKSEECNVLPTPVTTTTSIKCIPSSATIESAISDDDQKDLNDIPTTETTCNVDDQTSSDDVSTTEQTTTRKSTKYITSFGSSTYTTSTTTTTIRTTTAQTATSTVCLPTSKKRNTSNYYLSDNSVNFKHKNWKIQPKLITLILNKNPEFQIEMKIREFCDRYFQPMRNHDSFTPL